MTILNYFGICLLVNAGGGHENAKLPVAQSGDEPGRLSHAHTISQFRFLTLRLLHEVYRLPVGVEPCAMIVFIAATPWSPSAQVPDYQRSGFIQWAWNTVYASATTTAA
jgi:hypothetical protein